jgi:hypothetical protein
MEREQSVKGRYAKQLFTGTESGGCIRTKGQLQAVNFSDAA